ncbi:MAG TPA: FixH family protein, partial [Niabella sp.]|nr:FixH family protein [Niabella sp.]
MSWKYIVILILAFFLVGILSMVYVAHRQTNEMIDDNYYDKELAYQGVIDAKRNMQGLNDSVLVTESDSEVKVQIPLDAA